MKKIINKLKSIINKDVNLSLKISIFTLSVVLLCSYVSYHIGTVQKLDDLIEQKVQVSINNLKESDSSLNSELSSLSSKKNELTSVLSSKNGVKAAMSEYNSNKTTYTNQITQLNTDIENLDNSINQKQSELNKKMAEKQARLAAERAAAQKASSNAASGQTVYITNTGSKYHRAGCSYLRKSKIPISLEDAQNSGYSPCSRCF